MRADEIAIMQAEARRIGAELLSTPLLIDEVAVHQFEVAPARRGHLDLDGVADLAGDQVA